MAAQLAKQIAEQMAARVAPVHQLSSEQILDELNHLNEDRGPDLLCAIIIMSVLAYIAVALRLFSRRIGKAPIQADDVWVIMSLVLMTAELGVGISIVQYGGGRHVVLVQKPSAFAKVVMAGEVLYVAGTATVKLSVLMLYRRLFRSQETFCKILWALCTFELAYSTAGVLVIIFQCRPIQAAWDVSIEPSYCVNIPAAALAVGIINAVTDVLTLALPVRIIWGFNKETRQKLQIAGIFLLGSFVCVGSIYRCTVVYRLGSKDVTWDLIDPAIWAFVENAIGIVSACLPVLRPIYNLVVHRHHCKLGDPCPRCQISQHCEHPNQLPVARRRGLDEAEETLNSCQTEISRSSTLSTCFSESTLKALELVERDLEFGKKEGPSIEVLR